MSERKPTVENSLLVVGSVTAKQYQSVRLGLLRRNVKAKVRRISHETWEKMCLLGDQAMYAGAVLYYRQAGLSVPPALYGRVEVAATDAELLSLLDFGSGVSLPDNEFDKLVERYGDIVPNFWWAISEWQFVVRNKVNTVAVIMTEEVLISDGMTAFSNELETTQEASGLPPAEFWIAQADGCIALW